MTENRVIVDLRRHCGDLTLMLTLVERFVADLGGATVDWLANAAQSTALPAGNRLGIGEAHERRWVDSICQHMLESSRGTQHGRGPFWVLSYDNSLLSEVKGVIPQGIVLATVHLSTLIRSARTASHRYAEQPTSEPMGASEAAILVRKLLRNRNCVSSIASLPQKDLRPELIRLDKRAAKRIGHRESETLISSVIRLGVREGWLRSFRTVPGKSGTEAIYLCEPGSVPVTVEDFGNAQGGGLVRPLGAPLTVESLVGGDSSLVEPPPSKRQTRATEFEKILSDSRIGAIPKSREIIFDVVEALLTQPDYEPLFPNDLQELSVAKATKQAEEIGYRQELRWEVAVRCTFRLMIRAGILQNELGKTICDRIGRDTQRIKTIAPDFRLICDAFLVDCIIRGSRTIHYDDDTYYVGLTLYRQGAEQKMAPGELKQKADIVLTYLEQAGRIKMGDDQVIRSAGLQGSFV